MSADLEAELRAAFEAASDSVTPRGDLAGLVRRSARRRKRAVSAVAAAVILAAAGILTGSLLTMRQSVPHGRTRHHILVRLGPGQNAEAIAVGRRFLYVATEHSGNPPYGLTAYSRATGRPIAQVEIPATPGTLLTGPDGSVWLTFSPDRSGGPCGVWLLNDGLTRRSATTGACPYTLLPTSQDTALTTVLNGRLVSLTMPPPGRPGRATMTPYARLGRYAVLALAQVAGHVAALVTNDFGDMHVVTTQRSISFGGSPGPLVTSMAAGGDSLWVTTGASTGPDAGPLVRLSPALRPITPPAIRAHRILRRAVHVWSSNDTVWVATSVRSRELVCFSDRTGPGTIAAVPIRVQPAALAVAGNTVYLTAIDQATATGGRDVYAYAVPRACR